jgi:hypothetical protein
MKPSFDFGENDNQLDLFKAGEASGDALADSKETTAGEDGSAPISPLQLIQPKEIRLEKITMAMADAYSIKNHYLHRTAKNSKLALGIFARGELHGIMIWGLPVAKIKGQHGSTFTQIELRRMYCDEHLGPNSESKCLGVAARILKKLLPQTTLLVAYSDLSQGHKGGIYKAAGWQFAGRIAADKDGGWSKHPRHNRVELGDKYKWVKPLRSQS